jgi:hypothetical protein
MPKSERRWLPTLSEILDRLSITSLKELKIPENREKYTEEINDLLHDIQLILDENPGKIDASFLRDLIVLAQFNEFIWQNEANARLGKPGSRLEDSHAYNSIRCAAKNKLQSKFGGRLDYKLDVLEPTANWIPSGYENGKDVKSTKK